MGAEVMGYTPQEIMQFARNASEAGDHLTAATLYEEAAVEFERTHAKIWANRALSLAITQTELAEALKPR